MLIAAHYGDSPIMNGDQKPPITRRTISMDSKAVYFGTIATLVIAIIGGADAAHRHYRHHAAVYAKDTARCDLDKDYYATHSQWCDSAEKQHLVTIHHRQVFPAVQSFDEVTNSHDHQGVYDGGSTNIPTIRLQTADNVAHSSPWYAAIAAAFNPGALDLGIHRIARTEAPVYAGPRAPMRPVAALAKPTRITTNGGPVYITNSRVTVAQQ